VARSINKAIIVGNLTRDPEMRYTPNGQAVTNFGVATNRRWTTDGEQREEAEFHNIVAWGKLAEICSQLLKKGRRVYIEGRLQTRSWEGKDGVTRRRTEIVAGDMVVLDSRPAESKGGSGDEYVVSEETPQEPAEEESEGKPAEETEKKSGGKGKKKKDEETEDVNPDKIPF
jgi:single-strand DNA-binding protein